MTKHFEINIRKKASMTSFEAQWGSCIPQPFPPWLRHWTEVTTLYLARSVLQRNKKNTSQRINLLH